MIRHGEADRFLVCTFCPTFNFRICYPAIKTSGVTIINYCDITIPGHIHFLPLIRFPLYCINFNRIIDYRIVRKCQHTGIDKFSFI